MIRSDLQIDFSDPNILMKRPNKEKRTTIMVTLSDSSITPVDIQKLMEAGMNAVKVRMSHTTKEEKIRLLGKGVQSIYIKEGSQIKLTSNVAEYNTCNEHKIYVDNVYLTAEVKIGTVICIDKEEIVLHCTDIIDEKTIKCIVSKGGELTDLSYVSMRGGKRKRHTLGKIDYEIIKFALENQVDMLIINYVRHTETLKNIKKFIGHKVRRPFLISGICTQQGLDNIDDIAKESDAILLSREFLPFELEESRKLSVSRIQKWLGAKCQTLGKPYFISGDIFHDTLISGEYSDREVSDVTNALFEGASGLILKDSHNIDHVLQAVISVTDLCRTVEPYTESNSDFWRIIDEIKMPVNAAEACMMACVSAAIQTKAPVIVIPTVTGATARALLRNNPPCIIITVSSEARVTRILNACKCVCPLVYVGEQRKEWQLNVEAKINFAIEYAVKRSWLLYGDPYVTLQRGTEYSSFCDTVRLWHVTISKKGFVTCSGDEKKKKA